MPSLEPVFCFRIARLSRVYRAGFRRPLSVPLQDPSASTASSRPCKYLPRGFSLALPPAALRILEHAELDFTENVEKSKARAKHDAELRNVPNLSIARTDELAGLAGLLRREANLERKSGEVLKPAAFELALDYGVKNSSWLKPITEDDLKTLDNGVLAHDYWEYHINEGTRLRAMDDERTRGRAALTVFTFSTQSHLESGPCSSMSTRRSQRARRVCEASPLDQPDLDLQAPSLIRGPADQTCPELLSRRDRQSGCSELRPTTSTT